MAVLAMFDFDVIIGMDWLIRQRVFMDCSSRVIQFNPIDHSRYEFVGSRGGISIPWISSLEASKLLDDGNEGYLVNIVDSTVTELKLEDIPVVCNFPEVFPQELPGLPPERDIEFVIELAPGVEPISKVPYRMSLTELKELKVQMQELLDKGFIRPSFSP